MASIFVPECRDRDNFVRNHLRNAISEGTTYDIYSKMTSGSKMMYEMALPGFRTILLPWPLEVARCSLNLHVPIFQQYDKARKLFMAADGAIKEISYNMSRMIRSEILYTDLLQWYNAPTSTGEYLFICWWLLYQGLSLCVVHLPLCHRNGKFEEILPYKRVYFWYFASQKHPVLGQKLGSILDDN